MYVIIKHGCEFMKDINKKPKLKTPVVLQGCVSIPTAVELDRMSERFGLNISTMIRDACEQWIDKYRDVIEYDANVTDTI